MCYIELEFLRRKTLQILSTASESQPEPEPEPETFHQFSTIDEGLLAWSFTLRDHSQQDIASVNRAFRGFGREVHPSEIYVVYLRD